jgi:hypothetical protein
MPSGFRIRCAEAVLPIFESVIDLSGDGHLRTAFSRSRSRACFADHVPEELSEQRYQLLGRLTAAAGPTVD